jgi:hypothetical protein
MFTSHKGMVSSPKAIDFSKQRVRHGIYSDWNMASIPVVFILIYPRTCVGVLSLLYYTRDSVIQIEINNKSILHAYDGQT